MTDREKVIKGLECAIGIRGRKNCDDCPYDNDFNCIGCDIVMRDALALLKEQETVEPIDVIDEKYPVGNSNRYQGYRCGKCKEFIPWDADYCPYCGRKVKWDD